MLVLDYSTRQDPAYMVSQGVAGVMRYLSYSPSKNLARAEADALLAAGLSIGLVWETYANRALSGVAGGQEDARSAYAQAQAVGQPRDRPIYFAVDWDASEGEQAAIGDYLRGAASIIGPERVGVYGSYWVVKRCHEHGAAAWLWQTYAWSGGNVYEHTHIYQYSNGEWGDTVDFNEAKADDYGQWPFLGTAKKGDDDMGWFGTRMESTTGEGLVWIGHCDTTLFKEVQVMVAAHSADVHAEVYFNPTHDGKDWRLAGAADVPEGTDWGWPLKDYTGQIRVQVDKPNACYCEMRELH